MITNQVKACIVNAIEQGLIITQESIKDRSRRFNNSKNFRKIDEIMDQVAISLGNDYKAIKFERGNYELLLIYDDSEKILYSLFSNSNIKKLLHRKSRKKIHYADGFVAINANENRQLTLFEDENNIRYLQIEKIKNEIIDLIAQEPVRYYAIVFEMMDLRLCGVKCLMISEQFELISEQSEDWSSFIGFDYGNDTLYPTDDSNIDLEESLDITLKPLYQNNDLNIYLKSKEKDNNNDG